MVRIYTALVRIEDNLSLQRRGNVVNVISYLLASKYVLGR